KGGNSSVIIRKVAAGGLFPHAVKKDNSTTRTDKNVTNFISIIPPVNVFRYQYIHSDNFAQQDFDF
ncbi:MAG: hypothetical protein H6Q64_2427, partial [Firmicutes bacterium]|nr:hypothetical protein [Bacillota bacterium]